MKKKILIISGGISKERTISLETGKEVAKELVKNGYQVKVCEPNYKLFEVIKKFKTTAVIVTHDIMDAMKISDRIIVFGSGKIIQDGSPNEIYDRPNSKKVALLFGQTNFIPLELIPDSKNYFTDVQTNKSFIPIRPEQFVIYDEKFASNKIVFSGKICSVKKIGSNNNIKLETESLSLVVQLKGLMDLELGEELKVMVL